MSEEERYYCLKALNSTCPQNYRCFALGMSNEDCAQYCENYEPEEQLTLSSGEVIYL